MQNPVFKVSKDIPFKEYFADFVSVNYDQWTLRCNLDFDVSQNRQRVYVDFVDVTGFRVLDEGNLLEFWQTNRPNQWLLEIMAGGWFDLERTRQGFVTGIIFDKNSNAIDVPKEYLLISQNECINVISSSQPKITIHTL